MAWDIFGYRGGGGGRRGKGEGMGMGEGGEGGDGEEDTRKGEDEGEEVVNHADFLLGGATERAALRTFAKRTLREDSLFRSISSKISHSSEVKESATDITGNG